MSQQDPFQPGQPYGPPQPARKPSHWVRNIFAGIGVLAVLGIILTTVPLFGNSGGTGSTDTAAPGPSAGAPSSAAGQPSAQACTTRSCIASDMDQALVGAVAKDNAVATKVICRPSTVKDNAGQTWTATCKVTDSDGMVSEGFGNLVGSSGQVTYEPQQVLSYNGN